MSRLAGMHCSPATQENVRNSLAAIRAAAEILEANEHLTPLERQAFVTAIQEETSRLSAVMEDASPAPAEAPVRLAGRPTLVPRPAGHRRYA